VSEHTARLKSGLSCVFQVCWSGVFPRPRGAPTPPRKVTAHPIVGDT
jgi:hypothetical protein